MKKLLVLLALLLICNAAYADYIQMSNDLIISSTRLNQEQWTDKCALERLRKYSAIWGCNDPRNCQNLMFTLKRHCWPQYNLARQAAYMSR